MNQLSFGDRCRVINHEDLDRLIPAIFRGKTQKYPAKPGRVTITGNEDRDLSPRDLSSVLKQPV
jgi:hypothetical protein